MDILLLKLFRMALWVFFQFLTILKSSNKEVVFLTIEVDISSFPNNPYSSNSEFIWVCKYYDEIWASADWISDWAPLSILKISWATDIQLRWLKMLWKDKKIIYNFNEEYKA